MQNGIGPGSRRKEVYKMEVPNIPGPVLKNIYNELNTFEELMDLIYKGIEEKNPNKLVPYKDIENYNWYESNTCKNCSNNPKNGGSGICHCILGSQITY